jgi:uncharacterized RDD family membrane protein YckC
MTNGEGGVVGSGPAESQAAPTGKRMLSDLIDLLVIPFGLGIVVGIVSLAIPSDMVRMSLMVAINIGYLLFRDAVFAPGRKLLGLKLVSLTGEKATIGQAFIRNILLMIPFLLIIGYLVELIFVLAKGNRLMDRYAKTRVMSA